MREPRKQQLVVLASPSPMLQIKTLRPGKALPLSKVAQGVMEPSLG